MRSVLRPSRIAGCAALLFASAGLISAGCGGDGSPVATPEGGAGETGSGGAEGGPGGHDAGAGAGGVAGASGEVGETLLELESGEAVSAEVGPDGGTLELPGGEFSLEIPPGALEVATEVSLTPLLVDGELFAIALKPSGLKFEIPAIGRVAIPEPVGDDPGPLIVPLLFDDERGLEPSGTSVVEFDEEGPSAVRFDVPHFSVLMAWLSHLGGEWLVKATPLSAPTPWTLPVLVPFTNPTEFTLDEASQEGHKVCVGTAFKTCTNIEATFTAESGEASLFPLRPEPPVERILGGVDTSTPFSKGKPAYLARSWICGDVGTGAVIADALFRLHTKLTIPNVRFLDATGSGEHVVILQEGASVTVDYDVVGKPKRIHLEPVHCSDEPSVLSAMQLDESQRLDLANRYKQAWLGECVNLSDHKQCQEPIPELALGNALDPVLELGPNAALRFDAAFPCGEGPVGLTLCASGSPFAEGDWVLVAATTLADLVLDDPTGIYQLAFVFDADGDPGNNYQPSPQYPGDFFSGTDKWYEALYTAAGGWTIKVRDVRQNLAEVASQARIVLAGRELALLIPRAELDGAEPSFRVTAFRHEGDYGLTGGPWSASYFPYLDAPLLPAASGSTIVVPE